MTLQTILNKPVVASNGEVIGHVYDFEHAPTMMASTSLIFVSARRRGSSGWVSSVHLGDSYGACSCSTYHGRPSPLWTRL
jgi:hypothetical protein